MKITEKSYIERCMDITMGRSPQEVSLYIRVPSYGDLPEKIRETHRQEILTWLNDLFPDMQKICEFNGTGLYHVSLPDISSLKERIKAVEEKYPDWAGPALQNFPKEQAPENDSVFMKEMSRWLESAICARSASVYLKDKSPVYGDIPYNWRAANLVSAKVFPKFPYPLKGTAVSVIEEEKAVKVNVPWLMYRFYAPIFEKLVSFLVSRCKGKFTKDVPDTQMTRNVWTKEITIEANDKQKAYLVSLIKSGMQGIGIPCYAKGKEMELDAEHVKKLVDYLCDIKFEKAKASRELKVQDRIVPYASKKLIYIQLLPETFEKVKDAVAAFVFDNNLIGGEFNFNERQNYYRTYIIGEGDAWEKVQGKLEIANALHDEILKQTGIDVPVDMPEVEIQVYRSRDQAGNPRVCVKVPLPWDKETGKLVKQGEKEVFPVAKELNSLIKDFQAEEWDAMWTSNYSTTYVTTLKKGDPEEKIAEVMDEAKEMIGKYELLKPVEVNMAEIKNAQAEKEIRKNIKEIVYDGR